MDLPPTNATTIAAMEATWDQRIEILKSIERELTSLSQLKEELEASKQMAPELIWAIQRRDVSDFLCVLEELALEDGVHVSDIVGKVTRGGNTVLHIATQNGSQDIFRLMADHFPHLITRTNVTGDTVLHVAARTEEFYFIDIIHTCYVRYMRSLGSQFDDETEIYLWTIRNEYGNTALHEAVMTSNIDIVSTLFEADKDAANYLNKEGKSPLYLAVEIGVESVLRKMILPHGHMFELDIEIGKKNY